MTNALREASPAAPLIEGVMISADSHVMEDPELWVRRLPVAFRDRAPRFPESHRQAFQAHPGGSDPVARLQEMAVDGVTAEVLYPTLGLSLFSLRDAELQAACFRVYNEWLGEYCSLDPRRLVGIPCISLFDAQAAVAELQRAHAAGLKGALVWQVPPEQLPLGSDHYEPFWAAAEALDMPISFHILTGFGWSKEGFDRLTWTESVKGAVTGELVEAANGIYDLILNGVLERHPRLRFVLVESEIGWLPWVIEKMDQKAVKVMKRGLNTGLSLAPSQYFYRQVFATFFNDPVGGRLLSWWGGDNCMWSNDFPHPNSTWPHSRAVIQRDLGHLDPATRAKLVHQNAARLYGIATEAPAASR